MGALILSTTMMCTMPVMAASSQTAKSNSSSSSSDDDDDDDSSSSSSSVPAAVAAVQGAAAASGTTVQQLQGAVNSGKYANMVDAVQHGNVSVPADVASNPEAKKTWVATVAEKFIMVDGQKVKVDVNSQSPQQIDKGLSAVANQVAAAAGQAVANKGTLPLKAVFDKNAGKTVVYSMLLQNGDFTPKAGDSFKLYNYKTGQWVEFSTQGFRKGHYDLAIAGGFDMSDFYSKNGALTYVITRDTAATAAAKAAAATTAATPAAAK